MLLDRIANPPAGLLRRGSPVWVTVDSGRAPVKGIVLDPHIEPNEADPRVLVWNDFHGRDNKAVLFVALDLTDETGRAHLAAWVDLQYRGQPWPFSVAETQVLFLATNFRAMTPTEIDTLAHVALRIMGREA